MKGGTATLILADAIGYRAARLVCSEAAPSIHAAQDAMLCRGDLDRRPLRGQAMRRGDRLYYLGEGAAGLLGCIRARPDSRLRHIYFFEDIR